LVWESQGSAGAPQLVADASGVTHLFFVDRPGGGGPGALYHAVVDHGEPFALTDVLAGVDADYRDYRVAADPFGRVHVVFRRDNELWHVSAPGNQADDAGAWSAPMSLGPVDPGASLAVGADGALHVCLPRGHQVIHLSSADAGAAWSDEHPVAFVPEPSIPLFLACAADGDGVIHVAWSQAQPPNYYPQEGVFYTRSDDDGATWDPPEPIAGEHYTLPELRADTAGNVHFLWQGDVAVGGRYYRRRPAGQGRRWADVETVVDAELGGMSGDAPMAIDGRGHVHVVTSAPKPVWVERAEAGWRAPVDIAGTLADAPSASGAIEYPAFTISSGNTLHAAFGFDGDRIYYSSALTDAPAVESTPRPTPTTAIDRVAQAPRPRATAGPTETAGPPRLVATPEGPLIVTTAIDADDGSWAVWLGPLLALALVSWVVVTHLRKG